MRWRQSQCLLPTVKCLKEEKKHPVTDANKPTGNHPVENLRPVTGQFIYRTGCRHSPSPCLRISKLFLLVGGLPKCHRLVTGPTLTKGRFWGLLVALEMIRADASSGAGTSSPAPSR